MKKLLSVLLAILMVITIIPLGSMQASATYSGTCGDNLTWSYDESTTTLTISGTGDMENYDNSNPPWKDYAKFITMIVLNGEITSIGSWAFSGCSSLIDISIPSSVRSIGTAAFCSCTSLIDITLPNSITKISNWMFKNCSNLTYVTNPYYVISIGNSAFLDVRAL